MVRTFLSLRAAVSGEAISSLAGIAFPYAPLHHPHALLGQARRSWQAWQHFARHVATDVIARSAATKQSPVWARRLLCFARNESMDPNIVEKYHKY